ncbi:MAG: RDD family protein [Candidatus Peribacteraceae bacterium]|nr:RDD family protein [Candidatus Peribacteraceae bacterium]
MKHLATPHDRFLAKMIDWGIFVLPLLSLYYSYPGFARITPSIWIIAALSSIFTGLLILLFLQWVLIGLNGQSLGKVVMHIRIVDAGSKKTGGFVQNLLLRTWVHALMVENVVYVLCDLLIIFRKERRCLHDYLAGTIVIKA